MYCVDCMTKTISISLLYYTYCFMHVHTTMSVVRDFSDILNQAETVLLLKITITSVYKFSSC